MLTAIELKTDPTLKRIVTAAFPNYKKHKAYVSVFSERGQSINSYWDGGSRDEHVIVELATLRRKSLPTATHPYFDIARAGLASSEDSYVSVDHVGNVTLKAIPQGFALVSAGTFCGKPSTAHVYFHPADMPRALTA
jgi:hypothetical protein